MSARGFRLGGLMRLRKLQEEQAAAEAARANAERRRAEKRRRETAELLGDSTMPEVGDELTWRAAVAGRAALTGMVIESTAVVEVARTRVEQAAAHWSDAKARATALEKLADRHAVEVRAEEERAEQLVLDEAAQRRRTTEDLAGTAASGPADRDASGAPHPPTEGER